MADRDLRGDVGRRTVREQILREHPLADGGLQNTDCEENPVFCKASHAMISNCDLGMWMGDGTATFEGKLDIWKNNSCGGAAQPRCPPNGNGCVCSLCPPS